MRLKLSSLKRPTKPNNSLSNMVLKRPLEELKLQFCEILKLRSKRKRMNKKYQAKGNLKKPIHSTNSRRSTGRQGISTSYTSVIRR